jgi:hypothetical protein
MKYCMSLMYSVHRKCVQAAISSNDVVYNMWDRKLIYSPKQISMIMNDTSLDVMDTSAPPTANAPLLYSSK